MPEVIPSVAGTLPEEGMDLSLTFNVGAVDGSVAVTLSKHPEDSNQPEDNAMTNPGLDVGHGDNQGKVQNAGGNAGRKQKPVPAPWPILAKCLRVQAGEVVAPVASSSRPQRVCKETDKKWQMLGWN